MSRLRCSFPMLGLLLGLIVLTSGCRTLSMPDSLSRLQGTRLAVDDARAEAVLRAYLSRAGDRSALRGSARVLVEGPDFKLNRPQRVLVERPARLRFEVVGLFDQLAALLATDGRVFGFYDASSGQVSRGFVSPSLLWDLAKIDLDVHEVVALLLAAPLPSPGIARSAVWLEPDGRLAVVFGWPEAEVDPLCVEAGEDGLFDVACFVVDDDLESGGEIFLFDTEGRLAELRDVEAGGRLRYRAIFEDYRSLTGDDAEIEFPNRITLRSPAAASVARFDWKRVMLAEFLSDRLFTIPARAGSNQGG